MTNTKATGMVPALWDAHRVLGHILARYDESGSPQTSPVGRHSDAKELRIIANDLRDFAQAVERG